MSNAASSQKAASRRQRSIQQVHYDIRPREEMARPLLMPSDHVSAYDRQVAGHKDTHDSKYLGLLKCNNGTILKPIIKEAQKREVDFYKRINSSTDPDLVELRSLVPKYFGCTRYTYGGHAQEYIVLEDLTEGMLEPCIMDVKIGKRTWDPLATEDKIKREQTKYALCKQEFGFCIPGFHVYRLGSGKLCAYNKDYGKKLHGPAVKDAIRRFLNGEGGVCRALVLQLVSGLWRAQTWARRARGLRLYSASLLLLYDAARLRACCRQHTPPAPAGPKSLSAGSAGGRAADYSAALGDIRLQYRECLERLAHAERAHAPWATVKIIDFAHAFFDDDADDGDQNFREGLDSFVHIFEELLRETDDRAE